MTTPEGEGAQSGAEGTQSGAGETTGNGSTGTTTGEGTQSGAVDQTSGEADSLRAELTKQRERTLASDKRAADIESQLKQLRDKDLPEAEKVKRDFEESQAQVQQLQETNTALALKVAFLSDNTYSWHNPERALKLVDLSQVEIEADGSVRGLKDALKALATSDAYLIKQEVKEESKPQGGTAPGNNGQSGTSRTGSKGMAARIPALNTRVKRS
jgi:hypothetical protein